MLQGCKMLGRSDEYDVMFHCLVAMMNGHGRLWKYVTFSVVLKLE